MITKLYIENYKGFDKTYIPIEDINFLVGDNSTGKSTVMDLLYLIDTITCRLYLSLIKI